MAGENERSNIALFNMVTVFNLLYQHAEMKPDMQCGCIVSINNRFNVHSIVSTLHNRSQFSILIQHIES